MAAARTGTARVLWRHCYQPAALPRQLVIQLAAELEPALIENGLVQAGLGFHVFSRYGNGARSGLRHIPNLQILDTHHRVVLADRGRGVVQEVAAGVADTGGNALDSGFRLLPVGAEVDFADFGALRSVEAR